MQSESVAGPSASERPQKRNPAVHCTPLVDHVSLITPHQSVSGESLSGQPASLAKIANQEPSGEPSSGPSVICKARRSMPETKCPDCHCRPDCGRCSCHAKTGQQKRQRKLRCTPTAQCRASWSVRPARALCRCQRANSVMIGGKCA
jgi:hypothetical protein